MVAQINTFKFLEKNNTRQVILYQDGKAHPETRQVCVPVDEVFLALSADLPNDVNLSLEDLEGKVLFQARFFDPSFPALVASSTEPATVEESPAGIAPSHPPISEPKSLDDYCEEISAQLQLSGNEVCFVCEALLNGLLDQVLIAQPFHSKRLHGIPSRIPAKKENVDLWAQQVCLELVEPPPLPASDQKRSKPRQSSDLKTDPSPKTLDIYISEISRRVTLSNREVRQICEMFLHGLLNQINTEQPFESSILNGLPHRLNPQNTSDPSALREPVRSMLLLLSPRKAKAVNTTQEAIAFCRQRERMAKSKTQNRIAVVTLTLFPSGWLDAFISHYLQHSNADIFILALGSNEAWDAYRQERVQIINLPVFEFRNVSKTFMISSFASTLRASYRYTLVCDVDELIMAYSMSKHSILPRLEEALLDIKRSGLIRTYGFNVVQAEGEDPYNSHRSILSQRSLGHPVTSMNKVMILGDYHPLSIGQHLSNVPCECKPIESCTNPNEAYIFLNLHMKHACIDMRNQVSNNFQTVDVESSRKSYYQTNRQFPLYPLPYILANTPIADLESTLMLEYIEQFNFGIDKFPRSTGFCSIPKIRTDFFIRFHQPAQ